MCHKIYVLVKLGRLLLKSLQGKKFKGRKGFTQIFLKIPPVLICNQTCPTNFFVFPSYVPMIS